MPDGNESKKPPVELDPKGRVVIARKGEDVLVMTSTDPQTPQPFVIAHGYDPETGNWQRGDYARTLDSLWERWQSMGTERAMDVQPDIDQHAPNDPKRTVASVAKQARAKAAEAAKRTQGQTKKRPNQGQRPKGR